MLKKLFYVIRDSYFTSYFTGYSFHDIPVMDDNIQKAIKFEEYEATQKVKEQLKGKFEIQEIKQ